MPITGDEHQAHDGNNETQSSAPSVHEDRESQSQASAYDSGDPWAAAKEKFFEGGELEEYKSSKIGIDDSIDDQANDGGTSNFEGDNVEVEDTETSGENSEEPDPLKLSVDYSIDDLRVPDKFKGRVDAKIKDVLSKAEARHEAMVKDYKEGTTKLAEAFVNCVRSENPIQTLLEYAKEVAPSLNLPEEFLENLKSKTSQNDPQSSGSEGSQDSSSFNPAEIQRRVENEIGKIEEKYWAALENESDPKKARELFSRMDREKMAVIEAVNNAKMKAVLMGFYNKLVKPKFDEFGQLKTESENAKSIAERTAQVSMWDSADQKMKEKFPDWAQYKGKVKELLKSRYSALRKEANQSKKGHFEAFKEMYYLVSRADHLQSAKRTQRGPVGIKPVSKHIKTQSAGGSDWDSIKNNFWGDIIPSD